MNHCTQCIDFAFMRQKNLKFGIIYLHCLFYRAASFVPNIKRSPKASKNYWALQKQKVFKRILKSSNAITNPEEDEKQENECDPEG